MAATLVALTTAIYWQTGHFPPIEYDDFIFTEKTAISSGLGIEGIRWALSGGHYANWIPLAWLSHMADVTIFGTDPGRHHLVNVAFHLLNGLLLFVALRKMTGRTWESYLVAALFLVHPLHVESVAWIAERKDILCAFFWISAILAYAGYAHHPSAARYGVVALLFILGLLSKQMIVTFPLTLLLLDFWPLRRFERTKAASLLIEKIPLLLLSAAAGLVAYRAQDTVGAVLPTENLPVAFRAMNALLAWTGYLFRTAWPAGLAVYYPHPLESISFIKAAGAGVFLAAITVPAIRLARRHPYLPVGWAWYLVTLVPVIGFVQIGAQAMADRYSYVPLIGIFVALVWGASELIDRYRIPKSACVPVAAACLVSLAAASWVQTGYWRSTDVLFTHALSVTEDNWFAHEVLGKAAARLGKDGEAIAHYREAIRITNGDVSARVGLGVVLGKQRQFNGAIEQFRKAIETSPEDRDAHYNLAIALECVGKREEAVVHFEKAFRNPPTDPAALNNIGLGLALAGRLRDAASAFAAALKLQPEDPESNYNYAVAQEKMGLKSEALPHFAKALTLQADDAGGFKKLGKALFSLGRYEEAEARFMTAVRLSPDDPEAQFDLAASLERQGKPAEAIAHYRETLRLAPGDRDALERIQAIRKAAR